jgi:hypothetical protein
MWRNHGGFAWMRNQRVRLREVAKISIARNLIGM